ncbi:MAG: 50S ribosomal protein L15 [Actinobacteria bacterium]|nr:MAG: 50S ribosomal protein L15 [Actinomycetota bacterium]
MRLHELKPAKASQKNRKRIGRGNASGHGTTAGKGTKGQLSRSGGGKGPGFAGGQIPLQRHLPRLPGFKNPFKKQFQLVSLDSLNKFSANTEVNPEKLFEQKIIKDKNGLVKVLANGQVNKVLTVKAHKFSDKAASIIKKAGGKAEVI